MKRFRPLVAVLWSSKNLRLIKKASHLDQKPDYRTKRGQLLHCLSGIIASSLVAFSGFLLEVGAKGLAVTPERDDIKGKVVLSRPIAIAK